MNCPLCKSVATAERFYRDDPAEPFVVIGTHVGGSETPMVVAREHEVLRGHALVNAFKALKESAVRRHGVGYTVVPGKVSGHWSATALPMSVEEPERLKAVRGTPLRCGLCGKMFEDRALIYRRADKQLEVLCPAGCRLAVLDAEYTEPVGAAT